MSDQLSYRGQYWTHLYKKQQQLNLDYWSILLFAFFINATIRCLAGGDVFSTWMMLLFCESNQPRDLSLMLWTEREINSTTERSGWRVSCCVGPALFKRSPTRTATFIFVLLSRIWIFTTVQINLKKKNKHTHIDTHTNFVICYIQMVAN